MASIRLSALKKTYGAGAPAVDVEEVFVEDGEFLTLLGPSGCGKSTLLRMLAGLEEPSSGRIMFGQRVVDQLDPSERNVAMVFQNYALYPHMTVAENIAYPLKKRGMPKAERMVRVQEIAGMLKLDALLSRRPRQLSGGQQQRVALGRAMVREPEVYLFDEPLSNLDASLRAYMRNELIRLHARLKGTMVFVTHDQVEAMTMSTRIAVMNAGRIQQIGTPDELYSAPASLFVASFIGTPAMNFLPVVVGYGPAGPMARAADFTLDLTGTALPVGAEPGAELTLGLRPEHLVVVAPDLPGAIPAQVTVAEWLGNEQIVTLSTGSQELTLRHSEPHRHAIGDRLALAPVPGRFHVFDTATGLRLGPAPAATPLPHQQDAGLLRA